MGNFITMVRENKGKILKKGLYGVLIGGALAVAGLLLVKRPDDSEEGIQEFDTDIETEETVFEVEQEND